jgi:arabinofuranosyltransferase
MNLRRLNELSVGKLLISTLIFAYLLIVYISAWVSDDSFITFRTVDNLINGYGLTWNISERVQTYTHPLWMFVVSGFYFITREIYYTSIIISIVISLTTILLLVLKLSNSNLSSIIAVLILIFSKAFIDYSTSGLENPLTHLLIVLFFIVYFKTEDGNKKLWLLTTIFSLAAINRLDTALIYIPALIFYYLKCDKLKGLAAVALGLLPLVLWESFSLLYYGFLVPNTAYAKLKTGIAQILLLKQGVRYLIASVYLDPVTPAAISAGIILPFIKKYKNLLPISLGIVLYLIYLLNIGGDFMVGRFLSAPLLCSVIIISRIQLKSSRSLIFQIAAIVMLGFLSPKPAVLSDSNYGVGPKIYKALRFGPYITRSYHGVVDERMYYYEYTGLLNNIFKREFYKQPWIVGSIKLNHSNNISLVIKYIGFYGFYSGSKVHLLDPLGLGDPLLSRLPIDEVYSFDEDKKQSQKSWRIGHFERQIPDGYIETVSAGINRIKDPSLKEYYDRLSVLTRGNIWDTARYGEIWNFNTGKYEYLINNYLANRKNISVNLNK